MPRARAPESCHRIIGQPTATPWDSELATAMGTDVSVQDDQVSRLTQAEV